MDKHKDFATNDQKLKKSRPHTRTPCLSKWSRMTFCEAHSSRVHRPLQPLCNQFEYECYQFFFAHPVQGVPQKIKTIEITYC